MLRTAEEEEIKLDILQKHWCYGRRAFSSSSFFEEQTKSQRSNTLVQDVDVKELRKKLKEIAQLPKPENEKKSVDQELLVRKDEAILPIKLNASVLGDFPVQYTVNSIENHQFPVIGLYIDRRVIPGFRYLVKRLSKFKQSGRYLFNSKPMVLTSIGRGYARRFTFQSNIPHPKEVDHFYSDNNQDGYAFELQVISNGDKFTVYDANHEPQGYLEITKVDTKQTEIDLVEENGLITRRVRVKFNANVELYDAGASQSVFLSGVTICVKNKDQAFAETIKITDVSVKLNKYYLVPGCQENYRRTHVKGDDIGDVPTRYTITGLASHEMPVIGTYVDPRILPGFHYKVRMSNRKRYLFNGAPLRLQNIGLGYGKKLTFDSQSRIDADNSLWSDSHQDGLAFEVRVVLEKMRFEIVAEDQVVGQATVFRADLPQIEKCMEKVELAPQRYTYIKYIHVDVMCHIKVDINDSGVFHKENLVRVYGLAIARKDPGRRNGYVERIQNIGLDSQLNLIFAQSHKELIFIPLH